MQKKNDFQSELKAAAAALTNPQTKRTFLCVVVAVDIRPKSWLHSQFFA